MFTYQKIENDASKTREEWVNFNLEVKNKFLGV
jgi:hypothetical protein